MLFVVAMDVKCQKRFVQSRENSFEWLSSVGSL